MEFAPGFHPWCMKQISHISIPSPCTQNWDNMQPGKGGRFCDSCQKSVTDFTKLSNSQILNILSSSSGKICGQFNETQLLAFNNELASERLPVFSWQKIGLAAAFMAIVPFVNAQAKVKAPVEQGPVSCGKSNTAIDSGLVYKKITGKVMDGTDTLVGATVILKGTEIKTAVDINGNFVLNVPVSQNLTLLVRFIGYKETEVKIDLNKNISYNIEMHSQVAFLGEMVISRPPLWKRPYYAVRRMMRKVFKG